MYGKREREELAQKAGITEEQRARKAEDGRERVQRANHDKQQTQGAQYLNGITAHVNRVFPVQGLGHRKTLGSVGKDLLEEREGGEER